MENRKKIAFVVGNDPLYTSTIKLQLGKSGFDVKYYSTGEMMIGHLSEHVDLIVLNHDPKETITAVDYLRRIKHTNTAIPVLFLLSENDTHTASLALRFGASYYIEKDATFFAELSYALDQLDIEKKRKFLTALRAFRQGIFNLYGFY